MRAFVTTALLLAAVLIAQPSSAAVSRSYSSSVVLRSTPPLITFYWNVTTGDTVGKFGVEVTLAGLQLPTSTYLAIGVADPAALADQYMQNVDMIRADTVGNIVQDCLSDTNLGNGRGGPTIDADQTGITWSLAQSAGGMFSMEWDRTLLAPTAADRAYTPAQAQRWVWAVGLGSGLGDEHEFKGSQLITLISPPLVPQNFRSIYTTLTRIAVAWTAPTTGTVPTSYTVEAETTPGAGFIGVAGCVAISSLFCSGTFASGSTVSFRVRADPGGAFTPAISVTAATMSSAIASGEYNGVVTGPGYPLKFHYSVEPPIIRGALEGTGVTGWMAVTWGLSGMALDGMSGDTIVARVINGVASVIDTKNTAIGAPPTLDTQQDVDANSVVGQESAGNTIVKFVRLLDTGDTLQDYVLGCSVNPNFALAQHPTDDGGSPFTGPSHPTQLKVNNVNICGSCSPSCGPLGTCNAGTCTCTANAVVGAAGCECDAGFSLSGTTCVGTVDVIEKATGETESPDKKMKVAWTIEDDEITIEVKGPGGWVGIGLGESMSDADIYQGSSLQVKDRFASGQSTPNDDTTSNILASIVEVDGGEIIFRFKRKLDTGDSEDKPIPAEKGTETPIILAYHETDTTLNSKHDNRYQLKVDFAAGTAAAVADLRVVHGVIMALSWLIFAVVGWFFAAFFKSLGHAWFVTHTAVNTIAALGTLVAFIIAVVMVEKDFSQDDPVAQAHSILGLIVFILTMVQPIIGIIADRMWSPEREGTPVFPDKIHWWIGRGSLLLAGITCVLGVAAITTNDMDARSTWLGIVIAYIILVIIAYVLLALRHKKRVEEGIEMH